jgi:hypothetical protein
VTKSFKGVPWWALVVATLCLLDLVWRTWTWLHPRPICTTSTSINGRPILIMGNHHDNMDAVSLRKSETWETIWAQWDFDFDGQPDATSYFFAGRPVMNFNYKAGHTPQCEVYFYGVGRSYARWLDRGGAGAFTERIYYDERGNPARHEFLEGQTWRTVEGGSGTGSPTLPQGPNERVPAPIPPPVNP